MAASSKMLLLLKAPVMLPGLSQGGYVYSILCEPSVDNSPISGIMGGIDIGVDLTGLRICIPKDNISAYVYETVENTLTSIVTSAEATDPGFIDVLP